MNCRARSVLHAAVVAAVLLIASTGCEGQISSGVNDIRASVELGKLPVDSDLSSAASAHSKAMCTSGTVMPATGPATIYGEGPSLVHELVGRAPLDQSISDSLKRNQAATRVVWASWKADPELADPSWTVQGTGEVECADGYLYETLVLRAPNNLPATGLYLSPQFDPTQSSVTTGIQYGSAIDVNGNTVPLLLDLYIPPTPAPAPHPLIVAIHGGAFVSGSRSDYQSVAQHWLERGFAVASIDYRLDPKLIGPHAATEQLIAAANAIADAQESVRWLRAHATAYHLDTNRIAAIGDSAGGAIALGLSAVPDSHPASSPYAAYSAAVQAAVSTGAYLTPGLQAGVLHLTGTEAPILMFHYETDVASDTGVYAYVTCTAYRAAGDVCDYENQPGEGHTTSLSAAGPWWSEPIAPFLYRHLRLAD